MISDHDIPSTDDIEADQVSADSSRPKWEIWCVGILLVYFLARLLFFAVNIKPELPPDESTHLGIIGLYAETPLFIDDSPESHGFGLVTRQPHLYYFVLGKLLALNLFGVDDLLYLRLINVILAMLTIVAGYRLATRLTESPLVRILFLVMTTNTLMFTFMGGAVSYDNLVNLLAVLSVSAFVALVRTGEPTDLLCFLLWNFLGTLTKTTFLPLTLGLVALLLFDRRRRFREDLASLSRVVIKPAPLTTSLLVLVVLTFGANVWLYGSNLVRYGRPVPGCSQVLELEQCMENRIFARNWVVNQYQDGKLTFEQALQATSQIGHPGDRDHAVRLLQNERAYQRSRPKLLPRWDYIQIVWVQAMKPTIFGIQAHLSMVKDPSALLPYNLVLFAAFVLWVRGAGWGPFERPWTYLAAVAVFYFLFLIGYVNYGFYTSSHAPFLGVQGRYLFPILIPTYLVAARFLLEPFRRAMQIAILIVISIVFILGDFPYFLRHDSPNWYVTTSSEAATTASPRPSH
jgi:4-amino-4-deoxy-L-arabinose transferase-like glycosyltransferase